MASVPVPGERADANGYGSCDDSLSFRGPAWGSHAGEHSITMYEMQMAAETRRRALLQSLRGTAEIRRAVGHRQPVTPPKHPMVEKRASEDVEQTAAEDDI